MGSGWQAAVPGTRRDLRGHDGGGAPLVVREASRARTPRDLARRCNACHVLPAVGLAHRLGLARWIGARRPHGVTRHALRQRRREWPYDEAAKPGAGNP